MTAQAEPADEPGRGDFLAAHPGGLATDPGAVGQAGLTGVARGGVVNLAGAIISAAASVGLTIVVTRNFPKSAVGTFFVAMSLFLIIEAITNLGAYNGTIYFIARLRALHAERRIPAIIRATIIPVVVASVAGAIALLAFARPLASTLVGSRIASGVSPAAMTSTLRVLAIALPFAALADTMLGATRGYHEMRPTVVADRIGRSTLQLAGVAVAAAIGDQALLAPLWVLPYLPVTIVSLLWLRRIMRGHRAALTAAPQRPPRAPAPAADRAAVGNRHGKPNARGFWGFTAPRSMASVAQIVIQRLDIVLVGIMLGPAKAALYTAATRFLVAGQLGNAAIGMASQPQLTRLFALGDRRGAGTLYQVSTAWLILLTWPLYLLAIVFGPSVLTVFGRSYAAGSTVMVTLALAMLVASACGQVDMVLITAGRSSWSLLNGLVAMTANVGLDLVLIPRMGITGAAVGWAAAIGLTNLVPLVQVARAARVHPFGAGTAAAAGLTLVSFAAIPLSLRAAAGTGPAVSVTAVGAGCAVMALGLWRLRGALYLSTMPGLSRLVRIAGSGLKDHYPAADQRYGP
ncbi:MAG TPA: polysaccharide biosynthesis C-terminal domain-containing protein [Streptosporangiaceae bacterium]